MKRTSLRFYCFSPPVMLATFLIEILGAAYIVWRYKMTPITRLITAILVCLGTFQGAEYMLCGGMGVPGGAWSQLGYSAITLLPPLGIHLSMKLADKTSKPILIAAYGSALFFVAYFAFVTGAISGHTCYANYVVFDTSKGFVPSMAYGMYYYGWLLLGTIMSFSLARQAMSKYVRSALYALAIGYLIFIIPTTAANLMDNSTIAGIPSIMCGFAVLLAFVLIGKVAPDSLQKTERSLSDLRVKLPF